MKTLREARMADTVIASYADQSTRGKSNIPTTMILHPMTSAALTRTSETGWRRKS
ncbi:MAG: hypothetical protein MI757_12215 [Pirellulales bacterium]|nr:hypothetical protein [Pirellulales bacterium]